MKEIVLATYNNHKADELRGIFKNVNIFTLSDIGLNIDIIEDEQTYIGNSLIKCATIFNIIKKPVMADDSGLSVLQLDGAPGVFSARYGGDNLTDKERYLLLLNNLDKTKPLNASFVCALVFYLNPNRFFSIQEETKGEIIFTPKGDNGFGYDPIFFLKDKQRTMAELSKEEKNSISHRGKAARVMNKIINDIEF